MRRSERVIVYSLLVLCAAGATFGGRGLLSGNRAVAAPQPETTTPATPTTPAASAPSAPSTPSAPPAPATIATCDIYLLIERTLETDAHAKVIKNAEEAIKTALTPVEEELGRLQTELTTMRDELQKASPQDPGAQLKFNDFEAKRQAFDAKVQAYNTNKSEKATEYTNLVGTHFVLAYQQVNDEAAKVAKARGFTYVVAQKSGKIVATDPRRLIEEFLSRPVTIQPAGSDITEAVRIAMNLPEKSAAELNAAANPLAPTPPAPGATPTPAPTPAPK